MNAIYEQPSLWRRIKPIVFAFDGLLLAGMLVLAAFGLVTMYSAGFDHGTRFVDHGRNMLIALAILWTVSQLPPHRLMSLAVPIYTFGIALLIATAVFGITRKGATRWLDIGVTVIQPSEIMKLATPLMLAWWFQNGEGRPRGPVWAIAIALLLLPFLLVAKQPDLGTAILVLSAGVYVMFFAGLSWKLILPLMAALGVAIVALILYEPTICQDGVKWPLLKDYQKTLVCTLLDPTKDPLGKGFHILQGMIAIGSGGLTGKGFMQGTQTHLEFIPERTTDFIFAAFSEEFGLAGTIGLLLAFTFVIFRGLYIAAVAPMLFSRLLAGSIALSIFTYVFVNMGMVSGILPVVGIPLPFISYGGTAMVTLGLALGMLMSISRSRRLMQS